MVFQKLSKFQASNTFKPNLLASFLALAIIATGQTSLADYSDSDTCETYPTIRRSIDPNITTHNKFIKKCKKEKSYRQLTKWMVKKGLISSDQRDELTHLLKPLDLKWNQCNKLIYKLSQKGMLTIPHMEALTFFITNCDTGHKYNSVKRLILNGFTSIDEIETLSHFDFRDFSSCIGALGLWKQVKGSLSVEMIKALVPILESMDIGKHRAFIRKLSSCGVSSPSELESFPMELTNNLEKMEEYFSLRTAHESIGEWRCQKQGDYVRGFRAAAFNLLMMARSVTSTPSKN